MLNFGARAFAENGYINLSAKFEKAIIILNFIELACSVRIGEYWSRSFFASLWTEPKRGEERETLGTCRRLV